MYVERQRLIDMHTYLYIYVCMYVSGYVCRVHVSMNPTAFWAEDFESAHTASPCVWCSTSSTSLTMCASNSFVALLLLWPLLFFVCAGSMRVRLHAF